MTTSKEEILPGDVRTRAEIRAHFGGSPQGGICPTAGEGGSICLYSDPEVGEKSGYYDGWLAEDEERGPLFEYTGAGKVDNQSFEGTGAAAGNRAILRHAERGKILRVFIAVGCVAGSGTKLHRYLGTFALDALQPFVWRRVHGEDRRMRSVIVFRLRPYGDVERSGRHVIPPASENDAEFVPFEEVTTAMLASEPVTSGTFAIPQARRRKNGSAGSRAPHDETASEFYTPDTPRVRMSLRAATDAAITMRREVALTQSFKSHLEAAGHKTGAFQIKIKGLSSTLRTGLYDATGHILYEAKGTSSREDVRRALGKLLDYSRYVTSDDDEGEPRCVVLLPGPPDPDMQALLERYGVGLVYRSAEGVFVGNEVPSLSQGGPS